MCYFINLEVTLQPRQTGTPPSLDRLAKLHSVSLRGTFPTFQITDGHCSCRQVLSDGRAIGIAGFIQELIRADNIKNIRVGWTWSVDQNVQMKPDVTEVRLSVQEFIERNAAEELHPDVWYRLHDLNKYNC